MQISQKGIDLIKRFEGFRPKPYRCPAGVWTIGYGTTRGITKDTVPITEEAGEAMLRDDLSSIEKELSNLLPDTLTQGQYDAICSFCYNVGVDEFLSSTLFRIIWFDPDDRRIRAEFMRWVYADSKKMNGLVKRREAEADLYENG